MRLWLQMVVLAAIVALLANSQCYARCLVSLNTAESSQQHSSCHQSSHSTPEKQSQCNYDRHSETATGAEAKVSVDHAPVLCLSPAALTAQLGGSPALQSRFASLAFLPERAAPPDKPLFLAISVFRV